MPSKFNDYIRGYVLGLSDAGNSFTHIIEMCKNRNILISKKGIHNIIKETKIPGFDITKIIPKLRRKHPRIKRTSALIRKVAEKVRKENPPTIKSMSRSFKTSARTIHKIIHEDLKLIKRKKGRVHTLTQRHRSERTTNCRLLYENYLAGDKWQFIVTLDEAWFYLSNCGKKRSIYYEKIGKKSTYKHYREGHESFSKGFMVAAGYCSKEKLRLIKVDNKVKINSQYYQNNILGPIFREDIPLLYGEETSKVFFHQDKAPSHFSYSTVDFLEKLKEETKINYIPYNHIPVKSPDAAPMDFCVFGLLKQALAKRNPKTLNGLWKVLLEEWELLNPVILTKSLLSWKLRCRSIVKRKGYPIEHLKRIKYGLH